MIELHRDIDTNRIISYIDDRAAENKGKIEIPVVDQRFLAQDFDFVVKSKFTTLPDAVNAEQTVMNQMQTIQTSLLRGVPLSSLNAGDMQNIQDIARNELLNNLSNIVENNPNSIAGLEKRIAELESIIDNQRDQLVDWQNASTAWQETVSLWARENENEAVRADAYQRLSNQLSAQNEQLITGLKTEMDLQNIIASGSISSISQRADKMLTTLLDEVDSIRSIDDKLGSLSEKIKVDFLNEFEPESSGTDEGG